MKQIIVNVSGLTAEEKQRINTALAKITGFDEMTCNLARVKWMYAPSSYIDDRITYSAGNESYENKEPTHTSAEVLEMAEMETSTDQHLAQVDQVMITDSSGRIVYDGTSESISTFIKSRASTGSLPSSGFSVKTDENGVAVMAENRKVRKDFDPTKDYSVDVSGCTEEGKKEVQQAFFDVGILWQIGGKTYKHLDTVQYTNTTVDGSITEHCMYGTTTEECNMTPAEFLELVYEPEQQGHVHSHLMAQYASISATAEDPWNYFEILHRYDGKEAWITLQEGQFFREDSKYRRKPSTHEVNGVEVPDLRIKPKVGDRYHLVDPTESDLSYEYVHVGDTQDIMWAERGLCYEPTEEGKKAAIRHAKAWLGIA